MRLLNQNLTLNAWTLSINKSSKSLYAGLVKGVGLCDKVFFELILNYCLTLPVFCETSLSGVELYLFKFEVRNLTSKLRLKVSLKQGVTFHVWPRKLQFDFLFFFVWAKNDPLSKLSTIKILRWTRSQKKLQPPPPKKNNFLKSKLFSRDFDDSDRHLVSLKKKRLLFWGDFARICSKDTFLKWFKF